MRVFQMHYIELEILLFFYFIRNTRNHSPLQLSSRK